MPGNKPIAILVADDFEDSELRFPRDYLVARGYQCELISADVGETLTGKHGYQVVSDRSVIGAGANLFDGLIIPGGRAPQHLRRNEYMVSFVRAFWESGKPVAAVCHGPQLLIEADLVSGKTITSWPEVATELKEAGANWVDQEVVVDGSLITSRKPDDLDAFSKAFEAKLREMAS